MRKLFVNGQTIIVEEVTHEENYVSIVSAYYESSGLNLSEHELETVSQKKQGVLKYGNSYDRA